MSLIVPAGSTGGVVDKAAPLVLHDRQPDPSWVRRLREVSPKSDVHTWLYLRWFAEAERWLLYEMVPSAYIDQGFRSELEGAHPDSLEDWARIVSAFQWQMYRQYRVHARPCWVIQGDRGGHKVAFDEADQELCRAQGLPPEPPAPGDLPYAPFDERVVRQIVRMSKLVQAKNDLSEFRRKYGTTDGFKRTYRDNLQAARAQYVDFLNDQFSDGDDLFVKANRTGELENAPKTDDDFVERSETQDARYIETGRF